MSKTFKDRSYHQEDYKQPKKVKRKEKRPKKSKNEIIEQMIRDGTYGI